MKAAFFEGGEVRVGEVEDPTPIKGMALVRTHGCGLCASDLHFLKGGRDVIHICQEHGGPYAALDFDKPFVPGHEFVGELIDYGPGSNRAIKPGRRVTSLPVNMARGQGFDCVGFSHYCPGGFGEYMLLDENFMIEVPDGLDDDLAAMTEPLAVGFSHARNGNPTKDDCCLVVGLGAIGLGVVAGLKLAGIGPIVAADFNPARREAALALGADIAFDPRETSPYAPIPSLGSRRPTIVYECTGVPGMLQQIIGGIGFKGKIVMGGYCMESEPLFSFSAQNKGLTIVFPMGDEPQDIQNALNAIADGKVNVRPWLGERIGVSGVEGALKNLSAASAPIRTVVDPRLA